MDPPPAGDEFAAYADVVRVAQDDGPRPVAAISYDPQYRALTDIFRGLTRMGEFSERGLDLSQDILDHNAANYTVWQYRRDCLRRIHDPPYDLNLELFYLDTFADDNPKNYQLWHHRRALVNMIAERASSSGGGAEGPDVARELAFTSRVFQEDPKNYHAWAHRQYILATFGGFDGELEFVQQQLDSDIRNNSAWNHRWFVFHRRHGSNGGIHWNFHTLEPDILVGEVEYSFAAIAKAPNNESAWNYLRGLRYFHRAETAELIDSTLAHMHATMISEGAQARLSTCAHFLALLAEVLEEQASRQALETAAKLLLALREVDPVRVKAYENDLRRVARASQLLGDVVTAL